MPFAVVDVGAVPCADCGLTGKAVHVVVPLISGPPVDSKTSVPVHVPVIVTVALTISGKVVAAVVATSDPPETVMVPRANMRANAGTASASTHSRAVIVTANR